MVYTEVRFQEGSDMSVIYHPANTIDSHLIADLLEQHKIDCRIEGEYLQGGIGELQAMGLLRIWVNEKDAREASLIIQEWETQMTEER